MPDPTRVTRAVRRCVGKAWHEENAGVCPLCDTEHGWVEVPVDEECPTCEGVGEVVVNYCSADLCPDCDGSGRRLHNWATGWCVGDEVLDLDGDVRTIVTLHIDGTPELVHDPFTDAAADDGWHPDDLALVLSDPSHRPEPMRWKQ